MNEIEKALWDAINETWKPVPSVPGLTASSIGRISWQDKLKHQYPHSKRSPYPVIKVKGKRYFVHTLVAEAFHGPCPEGKEVNHKNGNKRNPSPDNLEYVTHGSNVQHAYDSGLNNRVREASSEAMRRAHAEGRIKHSRGESRPNSKLTNETARQTKQLIAEKVPDTIIARRFGVRRETIRQIRQGRSWKHV